MPYKDPHSPAARASRKRCKARYLASDAGKEKHAEYARKWAKTPKGKVGVYASVVRARAKHHDRALARWKVASHLASGSLVRQPCESCGAGKAHAHHDDYSRQLDVRWLCQRCHLAEHGKRSYV